MCIGWEIDGREGHITKDAGCQANCHTTRTKLKEELYQYGRYVVLLPGGTETSLSLAWKTCVPLHGSGHPWDTFSNHEIMRGVQDGCSTIS